MTSLVTVTATVIASNCPTKAVSNTFQSAPSTGVSRTSAVATPAFSKLPAASLGYNLSLFSGLPEDGAHIVESSTSTLSSLSVMNVSRYATSIHSELPGRGGNSSQSPAPVSLTRSIGLFSNSSRKASRFGSAMTGVSNTRTSGLPPTSRPIPMTAAGSSGPLRVASMSHFVGVNNATRGCDDANCKSDHNYSSNGPPIEFTYLARVTWTPKHL